MRVALVSTYASPIALGLRYISSYLKQAGHETELYFLNARRKEASQPLPPEVLEQIIERLRGADLIGVSLMTNSYMRAVEVTSAVKKAGIKAPVVWGGVHPTLAPEECLEHADFVCRGEGEQTLLEVVEAMEAGKDPTCIANLAYRRNGSAVLNAVRPLIEDLDSLPWPDYDEQTHWMLHKGRLVRADVKRLGAAVTRYRIMTTRGCPFACAFCNNAALRRVYEGKGRWVRKRGIEDVINELKDRVERFGTVRAVNIVDDLFFIRSDEEVEEFCRLYKQTVGLPMEVDAHPAFVTERKVRALRDAGCYMVAMGIQSGSERTLYEIYNRRTPVRKVIESIDTLAASGIMAEYHFIVDNPFEPDEQMAETMRFIARHIKGRCRVRVFPLALYPGTPLQERARREGVISERDEKVYRFVFGGATKGMNVRYMSVALRIVAGVKERGLSTFAAERLVDFLLHPTVRRVCDRPGFVKFAAVAYLVGRTLWKVLVYQPFVRPWRKLRRKRSKVATAPDVATVPTSVEAYGAGL